MAEFSLVTLVKIDTPIDSRNIYGAKTARQTPLSGLHRPVWKVRNSVFKIHDAEPILNISNLLNWKSSEVVST